MAGRSLFGVSSRIEQPTYEVVDTLDDATEVRRYAPRLAAEARLPGGDGTMARGRAFRILFDYIAGANTGGRKIAMTTPVESGRRSGQRIAMTTPVETAAGPGRGGGGYAMRFFLPASFTLETAPAPTDDRVALVEIPAATVAVRRFTGLRGTPMVDRQKAKLRQTLARAADRWQAQGTPVAWFYDPPMTLPFLRRNEVAVTVAPTPRTTPDAA
ncbi:SOUL family heme-binding protein [Roseospira goensis]|uniref:Heme-binding protein n=1 Tax=Roseospira goensis TaxID=391922 RepID=A0A7W6RXI6_9PROT|nr:heme-binding protein [Roseospira goensis]MBB4284409.1 hypothetical protein [Roseospira goensis]